MTGGTCREPDSRSTPSLECPGRDSHPHRGICSPVPLLLGDRGLTVNLPCRLWLRQTSVPPSPTMIHSILGKDTIWAHGSRASRRDMNDSARPDPGLLEKLR